MNKKSSLKGEISSSYSPHCSRPRVPLYVQSILVIGVCIFRYRKIPGDVCRGGFVPGKDQYVNMMKACSDDKKYVTVNVEKETHVKVQPIDIMYSFIVSVDVMSIHDESNNDNRNHIIVERITEKLSQ